MAGIATATIPAHPDRKPRQQRGFLAQEPIDYRSPAAPTRPLLTDLGLTAAYYALTYLGFAAPYLLALASHVASYPVLLSIAAALALSTAPLVARRSARHPEAPA